MKSDNVRRGRRRRRRRRRRGRGPLTRTVLPRMQLSRISAF
jgi:hypothetical protein